MHKFVWYEGQLTLETTDPITEQIPNIIDERGASNVDGVAGHQLHRYGGNFIIAGLHHKNVNKIMLSLEYHLGLKRTKRALMAPSCAIKVVRGRPEVLI